MDSTRQIAIQLPEGLQRLQLHLFANGLVGWSPEAETTIARAEQTNFDRSDSSGGRTPQTVAPLVSLSGHLHHLNLNRSNRSAQAETEDGDHSANASNSSSELGDFADIASDSSEGEEEGSNDSQHGHGQGMTDEEQIEAVQAFIIGDDTENPELIEAACMAATQLISSLADNSSSFVEPEVVDRMQELYVHLHAVEGGLQLKIGHGILARSIYIYGDDEDESDGVDSQSEESFAEPAASSSGRTVVAGSVAAEEGVSCPVCLSSYSSNVRMAALGCHHHVCCTCFGRLPRPKLCPLCRAHIASHVEIIL